MIDIQRYGAKFYFCIIIYCVIFSATPCIGQQLNLANNQAAQQNNNPVNEQSILATIPVNIKSFKFDARIMEIDLSNSLIIVAEKAIKVPTYIDQAGQTQYMVNLVNDNGNKLVISDFKIGDHVIVEGYKTSPDELTANSLMLLPQR